MRTPILALTALMLACSGCSGVRQVVNTKLNIELPDGRKFELSNPKEIVIDELDIDPKTDRVRLRGYRSVANEAAIRSAEAEAKSKNELLTRIVEFADKVVDKAADKGAQTYGIPRGYKMVPKDDPSTPALEADPN